MEIGRSVIGAYLDIAGAKLVAEWPIPLWVWLTLALIGLIIGPFFAYHRLHQEYVGLRSQLDDKEWRNQVLRQLADLREKGVRLRNEGCSVVPTNQEDAWWQKVEMWREDVAKEMGLIHPADPVNWVTLGNVEMLRFDGISYSRFEMRRKLSMLTQWFTRLEDYINERTKLTLEKKSPYRQRTKPAVTKGADFGR